MIIYPPFIGDTIPAFTTSEIKVPFTMNPVVSEQDVDGFALQIKDYITSNVVATLYAVADWTQVGWYDNDTKSGKVTFSTSGTGFVPDSLQYYKFQLGYLSEYPYSNEKIYYSTVSIGRCIGTAPNVTINGLSDSTATTEKGIYTGNVTNNEEKIYSYQFKLFDSENNILEDSGEILNVYDTYKYKLKYNLDDNTKKIQFFIKTINGYEGQSPKYTLNQISSTTNGNIYVKNVDEYIKITIQNGSHINDQSFIVERTIDKISFEELAIVEISKDQSVIQKDYTVEQGVKYYYSIRKLNSVDGTYASQRKYHKNENTNPATDNAIWLDYEDISLFDMNNNVLKIKFDPKVSSFKNTILESKTDTIGSKYPFFFRNGGVNYKEIPISGLVSYHMDENQEFMTDEELGFPYTIETAAAGQEVIPNTENIGRSVNLDGPNIAAERKFRLTVLNWLTNGEPKLFRSPTEGVYVIRLMNVSLLPNDTLGRMLYSFSATGYEVSDHDLETLINKGYIHFNVTGQASSRLGYFILGTSTLGEVI